MDGFFLSRITLKIWINKNELKPLVYFSVWEKSNSVHIISALIRSLHSDLKKLRYDIMYDKCRTKKKNASADINIVILILTVIVIYNKQKLNRIDYSIYQSYL